MTAPEAPIAQASAEHFWRVAIRRLAKPRAACHVDLAKSSPVATSAAFALVSLILSFIPSAASAAHWWEQGQSRVIGLSTGFAGPDKFDPAELAARKAALGFNGERLTIMQRRGGLDDEGFFFVSTAAGKTNEDYLRRYLVESKKHGLRVVIFFDVHYYNQAFADEHPSLDAAQRKRFDTQGLRHGPKPLHQQPVP